MKKVVAGNWKMNHGPAAAAEFFESLDVESPLSAGVEVLVFPPTLSFASAHANAPDGVKLGVQDVYFEESGAFTGQVSVSMAAESGASHVLVGHSERRHIFGELDDGVAKKTSAVLAGGLTPVVCVGETLDERKAGRVTEVIVRQLEAVLPAFSEHEGSEALVAYEPVWAIGTGETATPADAAAAHATLRKRLVEALGPARGSTIPLLYGGSVKPGNAAELMAAPEVDGVLVGGASLDPTDFAAIARAGSG